MKTNTSHAYAQRLWAMQVMHLAAGQPADHMGDLVSMRMPAATERAAVAHLMGFLTEHGYKLRSVSPTLLAVVKSGGGLWTVEHLVHDDYPYIEETGRFNFFHRWMAYWWPTIADKPWRPPGARPSLHDWVRERQIRVVG